jgi:hypothetical protein
MPVSNIQNHTLKEYIDSLINAKLQAIISKLGDNGVTIDDLKDIIADIPIIDWMDSQTWLTMATENDRNPNVLNNKIQAGSNIAIDIANAATDEALVISALSNQSNLIMNGNFDVNVRPKKTSLVTSATEAVVEVFPIDRFMATTWVGGDFELAYLNKNPRSDETMSKGTYRCTVVTPGQSSYVSMINPFRQTIDLYKSKRAEGKTVSVSFNIETNFDGVLMLSLISFYTNTCYRIPFEVTSGMNHVEKQIPVPLGLFSSSTEVSTGFILDIGSIFENTSGEDTTINEWGDHDSYHPTYMTKWYEVAGNYMELSELSVHIQNRAPIFTPLDTILETMLCRKYYEEVSLNIPCYTNIAAYDVNDISSLNFWAINILWRNNIVTPTLKVHPLLNQEPDLTPNYAITNRLTSIEVYTGTLPTAQMFARVDYYPGNITINNTSNCRAESATGLARLLGTLVIDSELDR